MLDIPEVIVPPYPGITSAMGLLTTDLKYDAVRTQFQVSGAVDLARLNADLAAMRESLAAQFARDGIAADSTPNIETVLFAELRLENLARARNSGTVQNLKDRRFDLYETRWTRHSDAPP